MVSKELSLGTSCCLLCSFLRRFVFETVRLALQIVDVTVVHQAVDQGAGEGSVPQPFRLLFEVMIVAERS